MAKKEDSNWRECIITQLRERNRLQTQCFQELIQQNNKLFENANTLRSENLQLSIQVEKLKSCSTDLGNVSGLSGNEVKLTERIHYLEHKILNQQEELTELHKRKGENAQQIIDLNVKLQEMEKLSAVKDHNLSESLTTNTMLQSDIKRYQTSIKELENLNQVLRDEHQALQLAFAALEDKLRKAQDENRQLIERLIKYKAKDADRMNEENDNFLNTGTKSKSLVLSTFGLFRKRNAKMQMELEEACRDTRGPSPDDFKCASLPIVESIVPRKVVMKFDAHESEVDAVQWNPMCRTLATGGLDKKVKLWDLSEGCYKLKGMLLGSNAGITSVDFDLTGTYIVGGSNDFASRVWTVSDQRLKHTLTGHSGKVMAAKFFYDSSKVVTGSHDRSVKIWDLRSRACIETKFHGSSCNDVVVADGSGFMIISGHFDKRIRFWDTRSKSGSSDIQLYGKITSLDLSRDLKYLLSCDRDDSLNVIDLRMNHIVHTFRSDDFKVGCDWTRATFNPGGEYIAVGSSDGNVFIWNILTTKIETILRDTTSHTIFSRSTVTATSWNRQGTALACVDKSKRVTVWD